MSQTILAILGPTASGKTSLSVQLAKHLNAPIISADSRQFYKEISIGTAKPTLKEQEGRVHYFIDSHSLHIPLNAANYANEALDLLNTELKTEPFIVLVGGSGLFVDALLDGFDDLPTNEDVQRNLSEKLEKFGLEFLQNELQKADLKSFQSIDIQNPHRVLRALEIVKITNESAFELRKNEKKSRPFNTKRFVLNPPRELLYANINQRVMEMISAGLVEEVKSVFAWKQYQSLNTVGYKEIFEFLEDKITLDEAIVQIQQNTRRYAKRQLTWFRKNSENLWISELSTDDRLKFILNNL